MSNNQIFKKRKIPILISQSLTSRESINIMNNKKLKKTRNNSYGKSNCKTHDKKKKKPDFLLSFISTILYSKYKTTERHFQNYLITSLIKKKKGIYNLKLNELKIINDENEYLKRIYKFKESKYRIPKYFEYYKNYLQYFCRPFILGKKANKILLKHMEKAAEEFYKINFEEENKNKNDKEKNQIINFHPKIFSKNVIQEIENERLETKNVNYENEKNKFFKKVKSVDGLIIKENEDISSFFGISKINYQITSYDDSILKNNKYDNMSIKTLLEIFDEKKDKKRKEKKIQEKKIQEKKLEINNSSSTTYNSNNNSKKVNKREIRNNISNLNLKYFSDFLSPKNKIKDQNNNKNNNNCNNNINNNNNNNTKNNNNNNNKNNNNNNNNINNNNNNNNKNNNNNNNNNINNHKNNNNNSNNNILEKLKESLHFKTKKNLSPNKLVLNAFNEFLSPFNINIKEKYQLKNSNSTKNLNRVNSSNKQLSKLTISTNFNPVFHHILKRPRRGVIFKNNNINHQSTNTSSLFIKSPMHLYSTQSKTIRSNSNIIKRERKNSLQNSKNGSQVFFSRKIIKNNYEDGIINNKKGSFNITKKSNEDSTRTANSRNNSHRKINFINLSKVQSSLDFIKQSRNKYKGNNNNKNIVSKTPINIKNNKSKV